MIKYILSLVLFIIVLLPHESDGAKRGLWLWYPNLVIPVNNEVNKVINQCKADGITDIYLYANGWLTGARKAQVQNFISIASCNNIKVWAMDGYRAYFSDWSGPSEYYTFINQVVAYNSTSTTDQRFVGIHGDNEPNDYQGEPLSSFHDDITDASLSTTPGSGVWQSTQKLDREYLMRDWLTITETAYNTCHANSMLYGQAIPSWLDDYYGESIKCTYNSIYQPVYMHMMQYLDDYCIMSYRTDPAQVINRVTGELAYASTLPAASRPRVWAGVETHVGVGNGISYRDTPGKNSKAAVWTDVNTFEATLNSYAAYAGVNIHDWINGWRDLTPVSSNIADPGCSSLPIELISFSGENKGPINLLSWSTSKEVNNDRFEIEKSDDGISFEPLTVVSGAGNSSQNKEYEHIDQLPYNGITYYRLKQYDYSGLYSYSEIIAINKNENINSVSVYPNPAKDYLHIKLNLFNKTDLQIDIYNVSGKLYYSQISSIEKGNHTIGIEVFDFAPSVYFIKVYGINNDYSFIHKIVVN